MKTINRREQKEQTKRLIVKTAYEVFSEKGIMNTRMSDISQRAGVSHGTLFVHFDSQETLLTEVIGEYGRKIALRTHELADSCFKLRDILAAHLEGIMEFEPFYTRLVIENRLLPKDARDTWVSIQSAVAFHFGEAAERERQEAALADIPIHMLFNMWLGLVHHYLANGDLFAPEGGVIKRYGDTIIDNYMKLIKK
jgi:AcrR family transcriptional regulator